MNYLNEFDQYLYHLAQNSSYTVSEEYDERINRLLEQLVQNRSEICPQRTRPLRRWTYVAVAGMILGVIMIPVGKAAIGYVQERMQDMTAEQIDTKYEEAQETTKSGDRFSRELSAEEQSQYDILLEDYRKEGKFPKTDIAVHESAEKTAGESFWYCTSEQMFYLPQESLTEEQLLEIIDYQQKRSYSIDQSEETKRLQMEHNNATASASELTQREAEKSAISCIEKLYGDRMESLELQAVSTKYDDAYEASGVAHSYEVTLANEQEECAVVELDASDGTILSVEWLLERGQTDTQTDEKQIKAFEEKADQYLKQINSSLSDTEKSCNYLVTTDGNVFQGTVTYEYKMKEGDGYLIFVDMNTDCIYGCQYVVNFKAYEALHENSANLLNEQELRREEIALK